MVSNVGVVGFELDIGFQMRVILSDCGLSHIGENVSDHGAPKVRLMLLVMVKRLSCIEDVLLDH